VLTESVLSSPRILGVPLLLLANKQDAPGCLSVEEIREHYEDWWQRRYQQQGEGELQQPPPANTQNTERVASLDVMGVSALEGYVQSDISLRRHHFKGLIQDWYTRRCQLAVYPGTE
jgi:signal recognition particle receptor subunit beta